MLFMRFEHGATGWCAQTDPLNCPGRPYFWWSLVVLSYSCKKEETKLLSLRTDFPKRSWVRISLPRLGPHKNEIRMAYKWWILKRVCFICLNVAFLKGMYCCLHFYPSHPWVPLHQIADLQKDYIKSFFCFNMESNNNGFGEAATFANSQIILWQTFELFEATQLVAF